MNILGINGGPNHTDVIFHEGLIHGQYHDSSVTLLNDGDLVFALEEERLTRIKHTNYFPKMAIEACLNYNKINHSDIDYFAFAISKKVLEEYGTIFLKNETIKDPGLVVLREMIKTYTSYEIDLNKIKLYDHHYCHAASTFYQSGFDKSLVLTLDGAGNGLSGSIYIGEYSQLKMIKEFPIEKSLGYFYLEVTEFLGFEIFDEYKVMGLAPYGNSTLHNALFESFYKLLPNGEYEINFEELRLLESICQKRNRNDDFNQNHKDIAASLQFSLERIVFHILSHLRAETGINKLCLAGGVALNCKMEGEILYSNLFEEIFVVPVSGDNGLSLGAAIACQIENGKYSKSSKLRSVSLGMDFSETEILEELLRWNNFIEFIKSDDIFDEVGELLSRDQIIGWFSGREEYGPRALGNRSIVADPRPLENKNRINSIIKMREGFRPFAPAVLEECIGDFFEMPSNQNKDFPFMTFTLKAKEKSKKALEAVVHMDGTARVQTVNKTDNGNFWKLINAFYKRTGTTILLNTSFNNNFEPIVHFPYDAIVFLLTSDINAVVIGNYIITRKLPESQKLMYATIELPSSVNANSSGSVFILTDHYLDKSLEISKEMYDIIKGKQKIDFCDFGSAQPEIHDLWRRRLIRVLPFIKNH